MKTFILRIFLFSLFPVAGFFLLHHVANLMLDEKCISLELESKIARFKLHENEINLIIAGDSRAERQLIPRVFSHQTGYNAVNIAVASCDLVTFLHALKKLDRNPRNIFIVSASSWQINDGAIDIGYLSEKCFQQMTIYERFSLFSKNFKDLSEMYKRLFKHSLAGLFKSDLFLPGLDSEIINMKGFNGRTGNIQIKTSETEITEYLNNHPWYKNLANKGIRWEIFARAFKELGKMDSHFIIFQPPVSPYWKRIIRDTPIEKSELYFSQKLKELALEFNNVDFYDFYDQEIPGLEDCMYYDPQHLNKDGSEIFSNFLANLINSKFKR